MKFSTTLIFSALFTAVGGFYLYLKPVEVSQPTAPPVATPQMLLKLKEGDRINRIRISNLKVKESVELVRKKETWFLSSPVEYPADPILSEGLSAALALSAKARRLIPEKSWEEYGLLEPSMQLEIGTEKSSERRHLLFGDPTPIGDFIFARWEGSGDYFLVSADLRRVFDRSLYSLRLKQVVRTPVGEISKIQVRTANGEYTVLRRDAKWFWAAPFEISGKTLKSDGLGEMIGQLEALFIKEFLDDPREARGSGISAASNWVKVWGKEKQPEIIFLGSELTTSDAFYAQRETEKVVFLIARGNIRSLFETFEILAHDAGYHGR